MDIHRLAHIIADDAEIKSIDALHVLESIVDLCAEQKSDMLADLMDLIAERRHEKAGRAVADQPQEIPASAQLT